VRNPSTTCAKGGAAFENDGGTAEFQIGDKVREGHRVGTVTDVGTVLIQIKTAEGISRVVCPWELVSLRTSHAVPAQTGHGGEQENGWDRNAKRRRDQSGLGAH
jgi:hypothetical protein